MCVGWSKVTLETSQPVSRRGDRSVGNIYDRLDAARQQREKVLETPPAANTDRRAETAATAAPLAFPTLKPPRSQTLANPSQRRWDWIAPWLIGAAIFVLIFAFAVS